MIELGDQPSETSAEIAPTPQSIEGVSGEQGPGSVGNVGCTGVTDLNRLPVHSPSPDSSDARTSSSNTSTAQRSSAGELIISAACFSSRDFLKTV